MDLLLLLIVAGTLAFAGWLIYLGTKSKEFKDAVEDIKEEIDDIEEFIESIPTIAELNIGHFLVGEAIFIGLEASIRSMRKLMDQVRPA